MSAPTVIFFHSETAAIKAKKLLKATGYNAKTVKRTAENGAGCRYGLSLDLPVPSSVIELLIQNGVTPN